MKVLAFNSSPRKKNSNTDRLLLPFLEGAKEAGAETELVYLHGKKIKPCLGCFDCWLKTPGACVQKDDEAELLDKMVKADIRVFATPLYVFSVSAQMKLFMDRIMPIAEPFIILKDGHCTHPHRHKGGKDAGMVVISNCGFHELDNFDAMMMQFKTLARHGHMKFMGALLRPEGEFLAFAEKLMPDKAKAVYDAAREAGRQAVKKGIISEEVQKTFSAQFMPVDAFLQGANAYFKSLMEQNAKAK